MNKSICYTLAKLLKEKGFEYLQTEDNDYELGRHSYFKHYKSGEIHPLSHYYFDTSPNSVQWTNLNINAPTIADVIMWLYEKHDIWIVVFPTEENWTFDIFNKIECVKSESFINSPTEAYEAAIEYTLTKLI